MPSVDRPIREQHADRRQPEIGPFQSKIRYPQSTIGDSTARIHTNVAKDIRATGVKSPLDLGMDGRW